jgi:hypothetical protein
MKEQAYIVTLTKDMVDAFLAMNTSNRPIKKGVVEKYKRDMANGHWRLTNQGIGVSTDGVLLDGQHRLKAIKECGYPPVRMVIVQGLEPDAQNVVDQQAKRSSRDIFGIVFDTKVASITPAVLKCLLKYEALFGNTSTDSHSVDELFEIYSKVEVSMIDIMEITKIERGFWPAPCLAAMVLYHYQDHATYEQISTFEKQVRVGECLTRKMPTYHLRNMILTTRKTGNGMNVQQLRYEKTKRALLAYVNGESLGILRQPTK